MPGAFGTLVLTLPTGETRGYPLEKSVMTLGSAETNDIILHDPEVSRVHARVESDEAGSTIVDLESARGILINGIAAERAALNPGDVVELGNTSLRFAGPIPVEVESDRTVVDIAAFERITAEAKAAREKRDAPQTTATAPPTAVQEGASDTLVAIQPRGSKRPIFCVQAGYRDAITLARLAHFLGTDQPFYGLQPPAVKEGAHASRAHATVKDLAGHYLATLRQVQPEGPYVLAGYDVGGILAFEIACQLKELKQDVALLALLDTPFLAANPMFYIGYQVAKLAESSREMLTRPQTALLKSGPAERIRTQGGVALQQLATRFPAPVTRLREGFVAVQEAIQEKQEALKDGGLERHLQVIQRYVPPKYEGRVTLFLATESPVRRFGAVGGWNSVAIQGVGDHIVPGTHETMLREPRVEVLAQQLQACLPH